MPLGVAAHLSPEEEAALDALRDDAPAGNDAPPPDGDAEPGQQPAGAEGAAAEQPPTEGAEGAQAEGGEAKPDDKPAETKDEKKGDVRAALRAARRGEQKARERAEKLQKELDELRTKANIRPEPQADSDELTDDDIEAAAADYPLVGKLAKTVKTLKAQLAQAAPATATADPEFEPPPQPPHVQDAIDSIPDLLAWQHDPDQTAFQMAVAEDAKLKLHPKWKDKPLEDRLAEVARRVAADIGSDEDTSQPGVDEAQAQRIARERLQSAPRRTPQSISQIGGGGGKDTEGSSLSRFMQIGEDEALAELARGG